MPPCTCNEYQDLDLERDEISQRAKQSKIIESSLDAVTVHPDGEHTLLRCPVCGQHWQKSNAWNWGSKWYLFKVPVVEPPAWVEQPFVDPDEVLIFAAMMQRFLAEQTFTSSDDPCRKEGCAKHAIKDSVLCLQHHVESLQAFDLLPQTPKGRWWGSYERFAPTCFDRLLQERHP